MKLDVEIGVLDPVRLIQPKRHLHQAAAKRRDQMQPGLDELGQPLKGERLQFGDTRGVSNERVVSGEDQNTVRVSIEQGHLLVTRHFPDH